MTSPRSSPANSFTSASPKYLYSIVRFKGNFAKPLIDLVPESWVRSMKGQLLCKYPPKSQYKNMAEMLCTRKAAQESWKHFKVEILQKAASLVQGQKRLERFQETAHVVSTDNDAENLDPNSDKPESLSALEENDLFSINGHISIEESNSSSSSDESSDEASIEETPKRNTQMIPKSIPNSTKRGLKRPRTVEEMTTDLINSTPTEDHTHPSSKKSCVHSAVTLRVDPVTNTQKSMPPLTKRSEAIAPEPARQNSALDEMLTVLEKRITEKVEAARRSLAYDLRTHFNKLEELFKLSVATGSGPAVNILRELNVDFPIKTLADFEAFDERLKEEAEEKLMMKLMSSWCSSENPKSGVTSILSRLLDQDVQVKYSGVGKLAKFGGKKNFSATKCFNCLNLTILERLSSQCPISIGHVISLTSKWLAAAEDRKGGRKTRDERRVLKIRSQTNGCQETTDNPPNITASPNSGKQA